MATALETMTSGVASPVQMAAFLMALRARGETVAEITGACRLMRSRMLAVDAPPNAVDIVGTGGDGHGTYNVSTCAAIVTAGAQCFIAGWCIGAHMKPTPASAMAREMVTGGTSSLTPSAVSTSEAPDSEETERLPCFAMGTPAPAATIAAQVETL